MNTILDAALTIFFFLLIITILVAVHEFGHFFAAKIFKVKVNEFAIGFGKKIFSRKYKDTLYSIRLFPLGGFVQLEGEDADTGPDSFKHKRFRIKAIILLGGIFMNIVVAAILLSIYLPLFNRTLLLPKLTNFTFTNTEESSEVYPLRVSEIFKGAYAEGKFNVGDILIKINDQSFKSFEEYKMIIEKQQGLSTKFTLLNPDTLVTTTKEFTLGYKDENGQLLGLKFALPDRSIYFVKYNNNIVSPLSITSDIFLYTPKSLGSLILNSFRTGQYNEVVTSVGGLPQVTNQIYSIVEAKSFSTLIFFTAIISLSLAFFNLLPIPGLDGGQFAIYFIEKLLRRKLSDEFISKINIIGFIVLITLAIIVNFKDIIQLNWLGSVWDSIKGILGR